MDLSYLKKDDRIGYAEWPAYLFDIYRVFPRVVFILSTVGMWKIIWWYMYGLLPVERTPEVSAFVGLISVAYTKGMDYYMQRGNDWSARMKINGGEGGNSTVNITQQGTT